jgi:hypothetical protein
MATEEHWAIKAVEDAAMKRAMDYFKDRAFIEANLMILGVNLKQVIKLIDFYETQTGHLASSIE